MSTPENKSKRAFRIRQPFSKKGTKYAVDPTQAPQPVNSAVTGTPSVQVKETRKGHISVSVREGEMDGSGRIKSTHSPKSRPKGGGGRASPKKPRKHGERPTGSFDSPGSSNSPDSAFFSGDDADVPPNMKKNQAQISKTYNYSYSRSGKVKENPNRRASLDDVNKRFQEDMTVRPGSTIDL